MDKMWYPKPEYSITREITIPYFTRIFYVVGFLWIAIVTLLNVAAVGYDTVNIYSPSFNATQLLWYEKFPLTKGLFPPSWSCMYPALITLGQCMRFMFHVYSDDSFVYKQQTFSVFGHGSSKYIRGCAAPRNAIQRCWNNELFGSVHAFFCGHKQLQLRQLERTSDLILLI